MERTITITVEITYIIVARQKFNQWRPLQPTSHTNMYVVGKSEW